MYFSENMHDFCHSKGKVVKYSNVNTIRDTKQDQEDCSESRLDQKLFVRISWKIHYKDALAICMQYKNAI